MKLKLLLLPVLAVLFAFNTLSPTVWKLDPNHSNLGFAVFHLSVSDIKGTVKLKEATITTSSEDFADAVISLKADMNTIDTDNDKRDAHLKTADFFDATKFPEILFESTSFKKDGNGIFTITGNLTLHGITKPITLNGTLKTAVNATNSKPIAGFKVLGTIKRSDFDVAVSTPKEILTDEVNIEANMEFSKE